MQHLIWLVVQAKPKQLDSLAKLYRHDISLIKNGVPTCFGLDGKAAVARYKASNAAQMNHLSEDSDKVQDSGISIEQAYDLYESELRNNRCAGLMLFAC